MRQHISMAFYCLASVVIILQLSTSFISLSNEQTTQQLLHTVTKQAEKAPVVVESKAKIDYQQMAEDMAQESY
ncbi:hypothetical protein RJD38_15810 [Vibrio scophthalmi]|uniref:Uncharacterized protein n=2 Tax=Vibrio scophthalmi TaxID=45658 RepID=A0A1B1NTU6_9VIBR|nr:MULTISPECIES: hypothetical protein [Vibrio]ANS87110.1 hypothetical protein VSVS12_03401 [Vibrio scophthalmi]ANU38876.1 hypothetical protein VSVS05_03840 [Vibrio scophthalmi]EGU29774.1 hypothetical protein VIS19158_16136 [Vibrio scophthalmi LMG 19158]EGU35237.1 hypothetical protein VIBRN418_09528 [Vibrio sp. N418]MCY9802590.1 hypothetical protein [Vibrio scophthalmi]